MATFDSHGDQALVFVLRARSTWGDFLRKNCRPTIFWSSRSSPLGWARRPQIIHRRGAAWRRGPSPPILQLVVRRYVPWIYWLAVPMVAIFGTDG